MKLVEIVGYVGYLKALASMVYKFLDKKTGLRAGVRVNEQLAKELNKLVIKKFKKKVYARFKDNICAADLAEIESLSSKNKNIK